MSYAKYILCIVLPEKEGRKKRRYGSRHGTYHHRRGKPAQFSCKMTVDPALWNTETGRMTGRSVAAQETNKMLDGIRVKINNHYREIVDRDGFVTAEKVKNAFLGLEYRHETLMKVYEQFNSDFDKLVQAGMRAKSTQHKYRTVYDHLKRFLETRYHVSDIALKEIAPRSLTISSCTSARKTIAATIRSGCTLCRSAR